MGLGLLGQHEMAAQTSTGSLQRCHGSQACQGHLYNAVDSNIRLESEPSLPDVALSILIPDTAFVRFACQVYGGAQ